MFVIGMACFRIGVATMFSQEWPHFEALINEIHAKFPDVPIIVGGEHATAASEYILKSCPAVKYVARGEGEDIILDLADFLDGKKREDEITGILYRGSDGAIITTLAIGRRRGVCRGAGRRPGSCDEGSGVR